MTKVTGWLCGKEEGWWRAFVRNTGWMQTVYGNVFIAQSIALLPSCYRPLPFVHRRSRRKVLLWTADTEQTPCCRGQLLSSLVPWPVVFREGPCFGSYQGPMLRSCPNQALILLIIFLYWQRDTTIKQYVRNLESLGVSTVDPHCCSTAS